MVTYFQEFASCGPEKGSCVGNQTLKNQSCLVPCTGLYADISDNFQMTAFDQNVIKGEILPSLALSSILIRFQRPDSRAEQHPDSRAEK